MHRDGNRKRNLLKIADFAEECANGNNREAWPQAPHDTAKDSNDFVAEELSDRRNSHDE